MSERFDRTYTALMLRVSAAAGIAEEAARDVDNAIRDIALLGAEHDKLVERMENMRLLLERAHYEKKAAKGP